MDHLSGFNVAGRPGLLTAPDVAKSRWQPWLAGLNNVVQEPKKYQLGKEGLAFCLDFF